MRLTCIVCGAGLDQSCGCDSKPDETSAPVTKAMLEAAVEALKAIGVEPALLGGYALALQAKEEVEDFNADEFNDGDKITLKDTFFMWHDERDTVHSLGHEFIEWGETAARILFGEGA